MGWIRYKCATTQFKIRIEEGITIVVPHNGKSFGQQAESKVEKTNKFFRNINDRSSVQQRETWSEPCGYSYFITKVFSRKETKVKINLDLNVFYELIKVALFGKRFRLAVCSLYKQRNGLYCCSHN
jgi:hypothetical protein